MPCEHIAGGIICTRGGRRHNCEFCSRYATKQCDFPQCREDHGGAIEHAEPEQCAGD